MVRTRWWTVNAGSGRLSFLADESLSHTSSGAVREWVGGEQNLPGVGAKSGASAPKPKATRCRLNSGGIRVVGSRHRLAFDDAFIKRNRKLESTPNSAQDINDDLRISSSPNTVVERESDDTVQCYGFRRSIASTNAHCSNTQLPRYASNIGVYGDILGEGHSRTRTVRCLRFPVTKPIPYCSLCSIAA
jgi:hypothetical protein